STGCRHGRRRRRSKTACRLRIRGWRGSVCSEAGQWAWTRAEKWVWRADHRLIDCSQTVREGSEIFIRKPEVRDPVKAGLTIVSLLPVLMLPWPVKMLIDHVIQQIPMSEKVASYPFFVRPFFEHLQSASPTEVLLWTLAAQVLLLLLIGAFGLNDSERT